MSARWRALAAILFLVSAACSHDTEAAKRAAFNRAEAYVAQQKYKEAVIEYRNALVEDPRFGEARLKLGITYEALGDYRNAVAEYIRAADLMPKNIDAQVRAGKVLLLLRQYPEAKARAQAVLEIDPKNIDGLMLLGNSLAGVKDFAGAIEQIEEAIETEPQRSLLYQNLGAIQSATGDKAAAEAALKRAVEIAPTAESHSSLANYYWAAGRLDEAKTHLNAAEALDAKDPRVVVALGLLALNAGNVAEAEQYFVRYSQLSTDGGTQLTLADFYLRYGKTSDARAILEKVAASNDRWAIPAQLRVAALDFEAGRKDEARQAIERILAAEPANELALLSKARLLMREEKFAEALTATEAVLSANKQSPTAYYLAALSQRALNDIDATIASYQQLLKLSPTQYVAILGLADAYLVKGDSKAALEFATQAVKARPSAVAAHVALARALIGSGQIDAATRELALLEQNKVDSPAFHIARADLFWKQQQVEKAREHYARALRLEPESHEATRGLIQADLAQKRLPSARERAEAQLKIAPNDPKLQSLAGIVFTASGDSQMAEQAFKKALELDSADPQNYGRLATLYMMTNRLDDAKAEFERMTKGKLEVAVAAHTMLGTILSIQSKPEEARQQYEKAIGLDAETPVASNNLAWQLAQGEGAQLDVALKLAQTAKGKLPKSWEVADTLGFVYYKKGLTTLAITAYREGLEEAPDNAGLRYRLGLAYLKNGDKRAAERELTRALQLDPKLSNAEAARTALAAAKS